MIEPRKYLEAFVPTDPAELAVVLKFLEGGRHIDAGLRILDDDLFWLFSVDTESLAIPFLLLPDLVADAKAIGFFEWFIHGILGEVSKLKEAIDDRT